MNAPPLLPRAECERLLLAEGWYTPATLASMSDAVLDAVADPLAHPYDRRVPMLGKRNGYGGPFTHGVIPDADEPTPEEIARAMNAQFVPCSALKGLKIAREIKRRELEAAGADVARRYGGDPATLSAARCRALANIHAMGSGERIS